MSSALSKSKISCCLSESYGLFMCKKVIMQRCAVGRLLIYICWVQHFTSNGAYGVTNHSSLHMGCLTQVNKVINLRIYNEISKIVVFFFCFVPGTSRRARTSRTARQPRCPGQWWTGCLTLDLSLIHHVKIILSIVCVLSAGTSWTPRSHRTSRREGKISHDRTHFCNSTEKKEDEKKNANLIKC